LTVTSGRTRREIAEDLGSSILRHWIDRRRKRRIEQPPRDRQEYVAAELKRLRRENEILRQERDILCRNGGHRAKRGTAFFGKEGSR
jgi:transposase